jgi:hypothetical protein
VAGGRRPGADQRRAARPALPAGGGASGSAGEWGQGCGAGARPGRGGRSRDVSRWPSGCVSGSAFAAAASTTPETCLRCAPALASRTCPHQGGPARPSLRALSPGVVARTCPGGRAEASAFSFPTPSADLPPSTAQGGAAFSTSLAGLPHPEQGSTRRPGLAGALPARSPCRLCPLGRVAILLPPRTLELMPCPSPGYLFFESFFLTFTRLCPEDHHSPVVRGLFLTVSPHSSGLSEEVYLPSYRAGLHVDECLLLSLLSQLCPSSVPSAHPGQRRMALNPCSPQPLVVSASFEASRLKTT